MTKVRGGTGSFDDFDIKFDVDWPIVPRVGEEIIIDSGVHPIQWEVLRVAYLIGPEDGFIGAMLLLKDLRPSGYTLEFL